MVSWYRHRLRFEYRFTGDQATTARDGSWREAGVLVHSQSPASMAPEQDMPIAIEVQLLGGDGERDRPTANVCTPGTDIDMGGVRVRRHCVSSASETHHGDEWVSVEVTVLGAETIQHAVDGVRVLTYENPRTDNRILADGYVGLHSAGHPVEFRKVELLPLRGCTDRAAPNHKTYYVSSDVRACEP